MLGAHQPTGRRGTGGGADCSLPPHPSLQLPGKVPALGTDAAATLVPRLQGQRGRVIRPGSQLHFLYSPERKGTEQSGGSAGRNIAASRRVGSLGSWCRAITQPPLSARRYVNGLGCPPRRGLSAQRRPFHPPRAAGMASHGSPAQPAPPPQHPCFTSRAAPGARLVPPGTRPSSPPGARCQASPLGCGRRLGSP